MFNPLVRSDLDNLREELDDFTVQMIQKTTNKDLVVEINTSALKWGLNGQTTFPSTSVIKRLKGAKFCLSSDSHWLREVGQHFEDAH